MPIVDNTWLSRLRRLMPPASTPANGIPAVAFAFAFGRRYSCLANATIDVEQQDADVLTANGWQMVCDFVGPTSRRPRHRDPDFASAPPTGVRYYDTTISQMLISDALGNWHVEATGAAA